MLFWQSAKVLNKNQEAKEMDVLTTSQKDNRFPSPLDSQDTQTAIVIAGKKDVDLSLGKQEPKIQTEGEFIVIPQKIA